MALAIGTTTAQDLRPSFVGTLRGEIFKLTRQRTTWIVAVLLAGLVALPWLASFLLGNRASIALDPLHAFILNASGNLSLLQAWSGFAVIVMTALVIGLDYQQGTIRIVLARGVERLQLLAAKLVTLVLAGAAVIALGLLLDLVLGFIYFTVVTGGTGAFGTLTGAFWGDIGLNVVVLLINMVVTILLVAAATVVGRSVAVGMTVGFAYFAADNIGVLIMLIVNRVTNNDFWLQATNYFLGPNLNVMAQTWIKPINTVFHAPGGDKVLPTAFRAVGIPPVYTYDITHIFVVVLVYAAIFAATAIILTWRRDVVE